MSDDAQPLYRVIVHVSADSRGAALAALVEHLLSSQAHRAERVAHGTVHDVHIQPVFPDSERHRHYRGEP